MPTSNGLPTLKIAFEKAAQTVANRSKKGTVAVWCPLTGVTLQVSEPPADIATAVSAGDFFLSHEPLVVD